MNLNNITTNPKVMALNFLRGENKNPMNNKNNRMTTVGSEVPLPLICHPKPKISAQIKIFRTFCIREVGLSDKEAELFNKILNRKKNLNLQITEWAKGFSICMIPISELLESFRSEPPDWVEKAIKNRVFQLHGKTTGELLYEGLVETKIINNKYHY